jgi:hypothetical protein
VRQLLACPFCRQLFERAEAEQCPECELALLPLEHLPPALSSSEAEAAQWEATSPDDERRAWHDLGRGRGLLMGIALASLCAFAFTPWLEMSSPYALLRSGYALCRGPLGWLWGGAIAWLSTLALVASRRSINQMRGVRVILMLFSAMTWVEILMLMATSPSASRHVHFDYAWSWGIYLALALGVAGTIAAARFGGPAAAQARGPAAGAAEAAQPAASPAQKAAPSSSTKVH